MTALLGLDWGTSSLRAYLLAAGDDRLPKVLASRSAPFGIMYLPAGGYSQALLEVCGEWLAQDPNLPLLAAGMVGSAQGWMEAPYVACPAGAGELAAALVAVPLTEVAGAFTRRLMIVPGVLQAGELPNVMRGEETQIVGALRQRGATAEEIMVLPGTHSKWVQVQEGKIARFSTFMTGELFATLRAHTILGRLMNAGPKADTDGAAFQRGVQVALQPGSGGLPATLFGVRALGLTGQLEAEVLPDYLSGLLIGAELSGALDVFGAELRRRRLILIGDPQLCERYQVAMGQAGFALPIRTAGATEAGLWQIALSADLIANGNPS